jgi:uncharacterized protein YprB with RNaseH-like and TPR domain
MLIDRSFIMLKGLGPTRERRLWDDGILDWDAFLAAKDLKGIGKERKRYYDGMAGAIKSHIERQDVRFLARHLPHGEHWRLYGMAAPRAAFIDIETDGLSHHSLMTVVGIMVGERLHTFVRGRNMTRSAIGKCLWGIRMLVTFNGSSFDLPFIEREFPGLLPLRTVPHMDLRYVAKRVDLCGGLKAIEARLGVRREAEVQMLAGHDAVRLWKIWERKGHKRALELLVDYNREDVKNMRPIADIVCKRLEERFTPTTA